MATITAPKLHYKEDLRDAFKPTLVFLHGLFSSIHEFNDVCCFLTDYNLILVHQPGHSESKDVLFTLDNATSGLHEILTEKDLIGKAHIVGLSLGGFVALEYARRYPGAVKSVFSTGATPFTGWTKWFAERPRIVYPLMNTLVTNLPDSLYWWVCKQSGL
jgi:pimeloyl-ACP methyl ester carboxylesterase